MTQHLPPVPIAYPVPSGHALIPLADFTKRWVCGVVRSGFHNGAGCDGSDPHTEWGCGWRYEVSYSDEQWTRRTTREPDDDATGRGAYRA